MPIPTFGNTLQLSWHVARAAIHPDSCPLPESPVPSAQCAPSVQQCARPLGAIAIAVAVAVIILRIGCMGLKASSIRSAPTRPTSNSHSRVMRWCRTRSGSRGSRMGRARQTNASRGKYAEGVEPGGVRSTGANDTGAQAEDEDEESGRGGHHGSNSGQGAMVIESDLG